MILDSDRHSAEDATNALESLVEYWEWQALKAFEATAKQDLAAGTWAKDILSLI